MWLTVRLKTLLLQTIQWLVLSLASPSAPPSLFLFPKDLFPAHDDPTILASKALPRLMMFFCLRSFNLLILFVDDFTVWSVSFLLSGLRSNIIPSDRRFLTTHGFYMMKYLDFFQRPELYVCVHVSM